MALSSLEAQSLEPHGEAIARMLGRQGTGTCEAAMQLIGKLKAEAITPHVAAIVAALPTEQFFECWDAAARALALLPLGLWEPHAHLFVDQLLGPLMGIEYSCGIRTVVDRLSPDALTRHTEAVASKARDANVKVRARSVKILGYTWHPQGQQMLWRGHASRLQTRKP